MSFNPFKPLIHNLKTLFLSDNQLNKKRKEDKQECLQFGSCTVQAQSPRPEKLYFGQE